MATPKVFVSSTCYDLQEERAQLERFISNYGFQPVLSEYSGVYYDVDAHTHESCVNEVAHCDLFVLIISGRYGGRYINGNGESITQAEYNKAKELGLPIFTFVKMDVSNAQHIYKENVRENDEEFAKKISYPAIHKQEDAFSIFNFIESVTRANTNNGVETYQSFSDIEGHLKKQWAGMFFTFLKKRKEQENVEDILSVVQKLVGSTATLESLVESLHSSSVGEEETKQVLKSSEIRLDTYKFYEILASLIGETTIGNKNGSKKKKTLYITEDDLELLTLHPVGEDLENYLNNPVTYTENFFNIPSEKGTHDYMAFDMIGYKNDKSFMSFINRDSYFLLEKCFEKGVKNADDKLRKEAIKSAFDFYTIQF
ncbi:DUF4062 domain-containing protein [Vibrio fluvialis]|uniref:DUF4062 domain-containing protein n=1 Tax=Vibrio fluvialis TaxID=676 RepID=UPI00096B8B3C|nr:DUF4062 domain-containing protein [Vibrio fluvialis]